MGVPLPQGLLDQAVQHRWNSEVSHAATRLRNLNPPDWLRAILPLQKFPADALPVRPQVRSQLLDRHPVHPWGTAVPLDPLKGLEHVTPLQHSL